MRYSKTLIPTVKEVPADAEIPSHQLMLRAGLMRKVASGTYTYLPIGWRILMKIMNIVRSEMNKSGAQEMLMPSVQPMELWQQTGRNVDYGPTMAHFTDRHGRENVLAPTAEEVVTSIAAGEINSYKQMPMNLYQISFKFRDEFRPRFGVLRSREFIMKDAYSFHADEKSLDETYKVMYETYKKIFSRCGLKYAIVEAESGEMGGSGSHQFTIPCESGEDVIVQTEDGAYAANIEKAPVDALPAAAQGKVYKSIEEVHTPNQKTIGEVCEFLKTDAKSLIKSLVYKSGTDIILALVRGDFEINPEKLRSAVGKSIELADENTIRTLTGAEVGFAGPVGLTQKINKLVIDHSVLTIEAGITGANKTDYHIKNVVPGRDFPIEGKNIVVGDVRNAVESDTYQGKKLVFKRGIEVGQVFKLGTKYSGKLGAKFLDKDGTEKLCIMGCYGIGINRIAASAIETMYDKDGIVWPINIAPFEVIIVPAGNSEQIIAASESIYKELTDAGVEVLLDDRDERGGVKFKDADLIGIPIRITVGAKSLAEGNAEIKVRRESEVTKVSLAEIKANILRIIDKLKNESV
ncbi:MAG: proline--tRNA ligase [Planctomycetes bacterium GWF2_41_51]|nr:MAG: proline--tRNA ligase [Planctomycetes bacterium GWF2_41_51]HBG28154.1 proline--tRNA ligase [Phycisphaerales bacterium]